MQTHLTFGLLTYGPLKPHAMMTRVGREKGTRLWRTIITRAWMIATSFMGKLGRQPLDVSHTCLCTPSFAFEIRHVQDARADFFYKKSHFGKFFLWFSSMVYWYSHFLGSCNCRGWLVNYFCITFSFYIYIFSFATLTMESGWWVVSTITRERDQGWPMVALETLNSSYKGIASTSLPTSLYEGHYRSF